MLTFCKSACLKDLLDNEGFVLILDTSVLLNTYRCAPDYTEYYYDCLKVVKKHIILPATVRFEYGRHCNEMFSKMARRGMDAAGETRKQIANAKQKIIRSCNNLEKRNYPDIELLKQDLSLAMDKVQVVMDSFIEDRQAVILADNSWNSNDKLRELVADIELSGSILPEPSFDDIIKWSEEGEKRYKKQIPPGFKDDLAKKNNGIRKYADLFIWKEILRFAKQSKKNIIFVTDDLKDDWWETKDGKRKLHPYLCDEFAKTGQKIIALNSVELYDELSVNYSINKPDIIEIALNMTDEDYYVSVEDDVYYKAEEYLLYNAIDYINEDTAHIGTEGIDEFEIIDHAFEGAERIDNNSNNQSSNISVSYVFRYRVIVQGTSYDYWGRDDDTKEIIRSLGRDHEFSGWIDVIVEREADIYTDYEEDTSFIKCEIIDGKLTEDSYEDRVEYNEDYLGTICPDCGRPLTVCNDAGTGFCIECEELK